MDDLIKIIEASSVFDKETKFRSLMNNLKRSQNLIENIKKNIYFKLFLDNLTSKSDNQQEIMKTYKTNNNFIFNSSIFNTNNKTEEKTEKIEKIEKILPFKKELNIFDNSNNSNNSNTYSVERVNLVDESLNETLTHSSSGTEIGLKLKLKDTYTCVPKSYKKLNVKFFKVTNLNNHTKIKLSNLKENAYVCLTFNISELVDIESAREKVRLIAKKNFSSHFINFSNNVSSIYGELNKYIRLRSYLKKHSNIIDQNMIKILVFRSEAQMLKNYSSECESNFYNEDFARLKIIFSENKKQRRKNKSLSESTKDISKFSIDEIKI